MKKVKLKLSWDELDAIKCFIDDSIGKRPAGLPHAFKWQWTLVQSVMIRWSLSLHQRLAFRRQKPFTVTLDVTTASAFMLFFGWDEQPVTTYLGISVLKVQRAIDQQFA